MTSDSCNITRRGFLGAGGSLGAAALLAGSPLGFAMGESGKKRLVLVGTGIRGCKFWGKFVRENYSDVAEFVGLCDINPGRLEFARSYIGATDCPTFYNFDEMLAVAKPDLVMVTTVDNTHDEFIVKSLNAGIDVVTEKPMTTTAAKCQNIVDAARSSRARLIMGFNYRYGSLFTRLKEMLVSATIGEVTSVDFNWYLNNYHGASYFRRWHGLREKGGTLLLHKAAHHFDLLNWWIGSDPVEVHAYGGLEHYGHNNAFRSERCTGCPHQEKCDYYWDIGKDELMVNLYTDNEHYDGYIRDACLWRKDIDIFDKMAVQIKYANDVQVAYSLTTYSPYEGFRLAFNGRKGRMETWEGVPSLMAVQEDQSKLHAKEMDQSTHSQAELQYHEIVTQANFGEFERIKHPFIRRAHWGGDPIMMDEILRGRLANPGLNQASSYRDGAMAVLVGIAARRSIDEGRAVRIDQLTDLEPREKKWS
ncbi:MAG: Gfo/Idh/MocA family oxidoreductase [Gammaproteobacteria bacterium]|nr:Gfo/Idh/MocA family oxidoreductase [Gammaproteobacteria bacterium]MBT8051073.1 Gfo/Idh/MocA family oxidoreductase [Gammaproteobacteria bacterium]NNJ79131.1 Gfo/Idh/MocA family oxidoreductase [Xanthomonadales bacterium]